MESRDLLGYAVNAMGGDKLTNLFTIAEELGLIEGGSVASRAIGLINPYNQYSFLEEIILDTNDSDKRIKELLKSYKIELPVRYGWKRTTYLNGEIDKVEEDEWYDDKYACYRAMHRNAMDLIQNAMDCLDETPITIVTNKIERISVKAGDSFEDVYELYEM